MLVDRTFCGSYGIFHVENSFDLFVFEGNLLKIGNKFVQIFIELEFYW